jgi:hypothetical protein
MASTPHCCTVDVTSRRLEKTKKSPNALLIPTHAYMVLIPQISEKTATRLPVCVTKHFMRET